MKNFTILEGGTARGTGKRRRAKLISSDTWGSSAYYPADVLERDAPYVFTTGTKMYENHLSDTELYERPEGDVSKLIGKLITDGRYEVDDEEGPGIYADVEFYDSYVDRINEIGDDVGLSVYGNADYVEGERDGRYGRIVTRLVNVESVDVVTKAGAGGKLVSIIESARQQAGYPIDTEGEQSVTALTKEDLDAGFESLAEKFAEIFKPYSDAMAAQAAAAEATTTEVENVTAEVTAEVTEPVVEATTTEVANEVVIDHAALITQITEAALPSAVIPTVVADVQAGTEIKDAIAKQITLREAFRANEDATTGRIMEAGAERKNLRSNILSVMSNKE